MKKDEIKKMVRKGYSQIARTNGSCSCGSKAGFKKIEVVASDRYLNYPVVSLKIKAIKPKQ